MNKRIGLISFPDESEGSGSGKPYSDRLSHMMDEEARKLVNKAYDQAEKILRDNQEKLQTLAEALLTRDTLNYDDVVDLIGLPAFDDAKRKIEPVEFEHAIDSLAHKEEK